MKRLSMHRYLVGLLISLLLAPTWVSAGSITGSAKADKMSQCVRETPFMRRNHFELIKHQRDVTVHQGIRKTTDSLAGCIDCHAGHDQSGKPVPVNAEGEFCAVCHAQVAVTMDCFSCHATVPGVK